MRVLTIGNSYPPLGFGGYEVLWQGVVDALEAQGHSVRVLTVEPSGPVGKAEPGVHRELRSYWHDHAWPALSLRQTLALERHNARVFDRQMRDFQPDVLSWWAMGGMSLGLIERGRRSGLPATLFLIDFWPNYAPDRDRWTEHWNRHQRLGRVAERLTGLPTLPALAAAGRWVFCSAVVRRATADAGVVPADWRILQPGVKSELLTIAPEAAAPPWRWRLLYIGRLAEQKGVHTAIESLSMLPPISTLRVVGDGETGYQERLERLAIDLGVTDRVRFEPPVRPSQVAGIYRESDAVLFPVVWEEPWGLVPLEAMALGRPVIATGRGGSGDYLAEGDNCLLFPPGDAPALAAALRRLAGSSELRERLRHGGRRTAERSSDAVFNAGAVAEIVGVRSR